MFKVLILGALLAAVAAVSFADDRNSQININFAPTSDSVEQFQFVNYKFVFNAAFKGLPVLANVYSTDSVFVYLTVDCNAWGPKVLASSETRDNTKIVSLPELTPNSPYCLTIYGWRAASYNISVSAQIVENRVMTGSVYARDSAFFTFQVPPSVFLLEVPAFSLTFGGNPHQYLGVNSGTASWTNTTTGPTSCLTIQNPPPGVYYYRLFAAGSTMSYRTAFILNGPGTCQLPESRSLRTKLDAHNL